MSSFGNLQKGMVPISFEQYLDQREPERTRWDHDYCDCCGARGQFLSSDGYCRACLQYQFGYDQAEQKMAMAMVGGAVKAALEAGASAELIGVAFRRALKGEEDWADVEPFLEDTYEAAVRAMKGDAP